MCMGRARSSRSTVREHQHSSYANFTDLKYFISERQKWSYLKDQMPDEVLLVRCFDTTKGPSQGGVTPHSAFVDEDRIKSEPFEYRQSIEVRCVVEY